MTIGPESGSANFAPPEVTMPKTVVYDSELIEISEELFGSEEYGQTALTIIDTERQRLATEKIDRWVRDDEVVLGSVRFAGYLPESIPGAYMDRGILKYPTPIDDSYEQEELIRLLAGLWPQTDYPFNNPDIQSYGIGHYPWVTVPTKVTVDRLAHFLQSRGLDKGLLPAALGKATDVMNVRAGLVAPDAVIEARKREPEYQYVPFAEFAAAAKAAGLSDYSLIKIKGVIDPRLNKGLKEGTAEPTGFNPIIDGQVSVSPSEWDHNYIKFQNIADVSLRAVQAALKAEGRKPGYQQKTQDFIEEYLAS